MSNIINAKWLKENLDNENLVIVDCRFSLMDKEYGKKSYDNGHIKGSVMIDIEKELSGVVSEHGGRHPLPNLEELITILESKGISNHSIVVAYDEGDLSGPSKLWWILKYLGHKSVYILDGGINAFVKIGGEISKEQPIKKKGNFKASINNNMITDMKYVKERLYKEDVIIVDCRESSRYNGEFEPVDIKKGHIPSAKNYFWQNILNKTDENVFIKNKDELNIYFNKLKDYKEVIIYCGSGITASSVSLALNEIDVKHKLYLGSFSDWISYEENEVKVAMK